MKLRFLWTFWEKLLKDHGSALTQIPQIQVYKNDFFFTNTTYYPTLTLLAFHTIQKQYLDTLHKQKKKEYTLQLLWYGEICHIYLSILFIYYY